MKNKKILILLLLTCLFLLAPRVNADEESDREEYISSCVKGGGSQAECEQKVDDALAEENQTNNASDLVDDTTSPIEDGDETNAKTSDLDVIIIAGVLVISVVTIGAMSKKVFE